MSDSLPENSISGVLRVLKLISGEEIISLVNETPNKIILKLPALLSSYYGKDQDNNSIEYVKLTNYITNIEKTEQKIKEKIKENKKSLRIKNAFMQGKFDKMYFN